MPADTSPLRLRVHSVTASTPDVRTLVLRPEAGVALTPYAPGSHVVLDCGATSNAYSLIGDGTSPQEYAISVLRVAGGRGSGWVHQLAPGDWVSLSRPRSRFSPVLRARRHLFAAGGIGVTALLPHVRAAVQWGRPFEMLYGYRPGSGAHLAELATLAGPGRLAEFHDRASLQDGLSRALSRQPLGTHLYVCGPPALIDFCLSQAAASGWPPQRVHHERFTAGEQLPGRPLRLRLRRSALELEVPADRSILDTLESAGVQVPRQCRQGVCGECQVPVVSGQPEHRDFYLSAGEREAGASVMACVSRALSEELELDL